jgi:hypothetical protein
MGVPGVATWQLAVADFYFLHFSLDDFQDHRRSLVASSGESGVLRAALEC